LTSSLGIRLGGGDAVSLEKFKARVKKLFKKMDTDKSGKLSVGEISDHLKRTGMAALEPDHIRALIGKYDDNDDFELDPDE